jgi:DNA helicase TIP49 (TBP-interacting protein)
LRDAKCADYFCFSVVVVLSIRRIKEESEIIEGEVVELEIDRPAAGQVAKMVR